MIGRVSPPAAALSLALLAVPAQVRAAVDDATCAPAPEPVVQLNYGSRYIADDPSRSVVDASSNAAVNAALKPIDAFIRDLTKMANKVAREEGQDSATANCVVAQLAIWAKAEALSELDTITANFSVGSRLAGIALAYRQVRPYSTLIADRKTVDRWLLSRANEQMLFWEEDATYGAKRGNLRAWATLAINAIGELNDNEPALRWSAWSATFLQCQALDDGSLPQEMKRGKYALHYQFHAIAPLVTTTLLLEQQGLSIKGVCDDALKRIVEFAMADMKTGKKSEAYSGKVQSYFDGTEEFRKFEFAWLDPYLKLYHDDALATMAQRLHPLSHSKLGGRQDLLW